jgi:hypothetical protein
MSQRDTGRRRPTPDRIRHKGSIEATAVVVARLGQILTRGLPANIVRRAARELTAEPSFPLAAQPLLGAQVCR